MGSYSTDSIIEVAKKRGWITYHDLKPLNYSPYLDTLASDLDDAWSILNKYLAEFKADGNIENTWSSSVQTSFSNERDHVSKKFCKNNYISIRILCVYHEDSKLILYHLHLLDKKTRKIRPCNDCENMYFINITDAIINFKVQVRSELERLHSVTDWCSIVSIIVAHVSALVFLCADISIVPVFILLAFYIYRLYGLMKSDDIEISLIDRISKEVYINYYHLKPMQQKSIPSTTTDTSSDSVDFLTSVEDNRFWDISSLDKVLTNAVDKITDTALLDHILKFYYKLESFIKYAQQNKKILNDYHINEIITRLEDMCGLLEQYVELDSINKISKKKETKNTMALIKKAIKADIKLVNQLLDVIFEQRVSTIKNKVSVSTAIVDEYNLYLKK